jgi:hypothetical protein
MLTFGGYVPDPCSRLFACKIKNHKYCMTYNSIDLQRETMRHSIGKFAKDWKFSRKFKFKKRKSGWFPFMRSLNRHIIAGDILCADLDPPLMTAKQKIINLLWCTTQLLYKGKLWDIQSENPLKIGSFMGSLNLKRERVVDSHLWEV